MKASKPHPEKVLTAARIRAISEPGRYTDGNGLYLIVDPSGAKRWLLRTVVRGKRRDIGLGGLKVVSLADAREKAAALRKLARSGGDPLLERRRERTAIPSFEEAARRVHTEHGPSWKNAKHTAQWISTLEKYVFPTLGQERVDVIEPPHLLKVLSPIWLVKPETARRIRQRIGTVMDWAKAAGFRTGPNPVDGLEKGLPKQPERAGHHAALAYTELPNFIKKLRRADAGESVRLAMEFLILTACRTSEVLFATWAEIGTDNKVWTIPAARMKAGREHKVPLSPRCREILERAKKLGGDSGFIFKGRGAQKPLSNMAFLMLLRRMQLDVTAHGFRSTFRDWAAERTNAPREVCEQALAHSIRDKTEAAYRRGDMLEKRADLMTSWAAFATSTPADIIRLHTRSPRKNARP